MLYVGLSRLFSALRILHWCLYLRRVNSHLTVRSKFVKRQDNLVDIIFRYVTVYMCRKTRNNKPFPTMTCQCSHIFVWFCHPRLSFPSSVRRSILNYVVDKNSLPFLKHFTTYSWYGSSFISFKSTCNHFSSFYFIL